MNMYIAQVRNGTLDVIESLGAVDPQSTCRHWRRYRRP
jgi:hypothetical protein